MGSPVGVTVAVVPVVAPGASAWRGAAARQHVGGAGKRAGGGADRAANHRANRTRRPITARGPGRLARHCAGYGVPIAERPDRLTDPTIKRVTRRGVGRGDRKSTRLNSSHRCISYAVFCLKKKKKNKKTEQITWK